MTRSERQRPLIHNPLELRRRRIAAGMEQADLAEAADLSASHVSLLEHGKRSPTPQALFRLATVLDCLPEDLMAEELISR
ncbi:helix-turn-helix domain-containing protein [Nonomuraea sp. ATR24]|uniref:helix-turn-helix domain-containing protein n=1 Tax=Nonomuraea sp. ATR24 TaxID=1676744 RepID=UPI0035BF8C9C